MWWAFSKWIYFRRGFIHPPVHSCHSGIHSFLIHACIHSFLIHTCIHSVSIYGAPALCQAPFLVLGLHQWIRQRCLPLNSLYSSRCKTTVNPYNKYIIYIVCEKLINVTERKKTWNRIWTHAGGRRWIQDDRQCSGWGLREKVRPEHRGRKRVRHLTWGKGGSWEEVGAMFLQCMLPWA